MQDEMTADQEGVFRSGPELVGLLTNFICPCGKSILKGVGASNAAALTWRAPFHPLDRIFYRWPRDQSRSRPTQTGKQCLWQRLRSKQINLLRERLSEQAALWCEQAKALPAGYARQELLRKARQTDVTAHLDEWLRSPGLQPPKW